MSYYMDNGYFEEADEVAYLIEHNMNDRTEYQAWDDILRCYSYTRPGRALRIYKNTGRCGRKVQALQTNFTKH